TRVNFIALAGPTPREWEETSYAVSPTAYRAGGSRLVLCGGDARQSRPPRDRPPSAKPRRQRFGHGTGGQDPPTLFDAEADRYHERQAAQGRLDDPSQELRARWQVFARGDAARQRRHHVYQYRERRRLCTRRQDRSDPVGALVPDRPDDFDDLLRMA